MSVLRWAFPSFCAAYRWADSRLTTGGKWCGLILLICSIPVLQASGSVTPLFAMFASLMLVSAVANFAFRPGLVVKVNAVSAVHCGDDVAINVHVQNRRNLTAYDVELKFAPDLDFRPGTRCCHRFGPIERGGGATFDATLRPRRRGVLAWPKLEVTSTFPFHLMRTTSIVRAPGELIVYPFRPPDVWLPIGKWFPTLAADAAETLPRAGSSSDYASSREYHAGMSVRRWDYRSWARLNRPVVREYDEPKLKRVILIVDTFTPSGTGLDEPNGQFEAVLSAAAATMDACAWHGMVIEQMFVGNREAANANPLTVDEPAGLEALARADPVSESALLKLLAIVRSSLAAGFVIAVLSRWDSLRQELCSELRQQGCPWGALLILHGADPRPATLPEEVIALEWPMPDFVAGEPR